MDRLTADALVDLEAIKTLRARYCRYIDTKQWAALRTLFDDDARFDGFASAPTGAGPDQFVAGVSARLSDAITVHHCHTPEIAFVDATNARGVWAMMDYLEWPSAGQVPHAPASRGLYGFGYYEEAYRKVGGEWKFALLRLSRLRIVPLPDDHPSPGGVTLLAPTPDWLDRA